MVQIIFVVIATADAASCSSAEQAAMQKMDAQTFGGGVVAARQDASNMSNLCMRRSPKNFVICIIRERRTLLLRISTVLHA